MNECVTQLQMKDITRKNK